jgi:hypothetical protein
LNRSPKKAADPGSDAAERTSERGITISMVVADFKLAPS